MIELNTLIVHVGTLVSSIITKALHHITKPPINRLNTYISPTEILVDIIDILICLNTAAGGGQTRPVGHFFNDKEGMATVQCFTCLKTHNSNLCSFLVLEVGCEMFAFLLIVLLIYYS